MSSIADAIRFVKISVLFSLDSGGSVLVYQYTLRADTKQQTIPHTQSMSGKQRKYNDYSLVYRYTRTEPQKSAIGSAVPVQFAISNRIDRLLNLELQTKGIIYYHSKIEIWHNANPFRI